MMSQTVQGKNVSQVDVRVTQGDFSELSKEEVKKHAFNRFKSGFHSPHRVAPHRTRVPRFSRPSGPIESSDGLVKSTIKLDTIEHVLLGDALNLKLPDPDHKPDSNGIPYTVWKTGENGNKFNFKELDTTLNDQSLSYGQISGLAGDFYATYKPITGNVGEKSLSETEQRARFIAAWHLLARETKSVDETKDILHNESKFEQAPYQEWKDYVKANDLQPSWIFAKEMPSALSETIAWTANTFNRGKDYPSYLGILLSNFDHFGEDAHCAYSVGHAAALHHAIEAGKTKDQNKLKIAYAMNAFADHFLEDSFSSGHIRTPRRLLHGGKVFEFEHIKYPAKDLCSNLMHDEDCALGIKVRNRRRFKSDGKTPANPDQWTCYGDAYIHDANSECNKAICMEALNASVEEVWLAYCTQVMPSQFIAMDLVPVIESAFEAHDKHLAPLFKVFDGVLKMRNWTWNLKWKEVGGIVSVPEEYEYHLNREDWSDRNYPNELTDPLTWWTALYYNSGWWNYPLRLDKASPA